MRMESNLSPMLIPEGERKRGDRLDDRESEPLLSSSKVEEQEFNPFASPTSMHKIQRNPCKEYCLRWLFLFVLFVAALMLPEPLVEIEAQVPFYNRDAKAYIHESSIIQAKTQASGALVASSSSSSEKERENKDFTLEIIYIAKDGDALTRAHLQDIEELEREILFDSGFTDYCALNYDLDATDGKCYRHDTALNFFASDFWLPVNYSDNMQAFIREGTIESSSNLSDLSPTKASQENYELGALSRLWDLNITMNEGDMYNYYVIGDPQNKVSTSLSRIGENDAFYDTARSYWQYYCDPSQDCASFETSSSSWPLNLTTPYTYLLNTTNTSWGNSFRDVVDLTFGFSDSGSVGSSAKALKSTFYFGSPMLDGHGNLYNTEGTDKITQQLKLGEYLYANIKPLLDRNMKGIEIVFSNADNGLLDAYIADKLVLDGLLAIGSFFFVLIYLGMMNGSFYLGASGMVLVVANFLPAIYIYHFVAGYKYFGTLNMLAVFIVLGIGADDIFVFLDTYRAMKSHLPPNTPYHSILYHTLSRSGKAMLTTSLSTGLSFLVNAISKIEAVASFGVFCALLIFCNFLSVVIFWPAGVAVYEYYINTKAKDDLEDAKRSANSGKTDTNAHAKKKCHYFSLKAKEDRGYDSAYYHHDEVHQENQNVTHEHNAHQSNLKAINTKTVVPQAHEHDVEGKDNQHNDQQLGVELVGLQHSTESSSSSPYDPFPSPTKNVTKNTFSLGSMPSNTSKQGENGLYVNLSSSPSATSIRSTMSKFDDTKTPGNVEKFFRDTFYPFIHRYNKLILFLFGILFLIYVSFGSQIEPDPERPTIFPDSDPFQSYFDKRENLFGVNAIRVNLQVVFGIDSLNQNVCEGRPCVTTTASDLGTVSFNKDINDIAQPYAQKFMLDLCNDIENGENAISVRKVYEADSVISSPVKCVFQSFQDWCEEKNCCTQSHATLSSSDYICDESDFWSAFESFLEADQLATDPGYIRGNTNADMWDNYVFVEEILGEKVFRFFTIGVDLSVDYTYKYDLGIELFQDWERWINQWIQAQQTSLYGTLNSNFINSGFVGDQIAFSYYYIQKQTLQEAATGMTLSLCLAFIVLCCATANWVVSLYAIFCIGSMVLGTLAYTVMSGAKLGILEAILFIMVVGLSVDYAVHLADAYLESEYVTREHRTRDMLYKMGVSVLSGAISTLGSSFFMLFAYIIFLSKFGTYIFFIILQSIIFSLFPFTAMLDLFGPQRPLPGKDLHNGTEVRVYIELIEEDHTYQDYRGEHQHIGSVKELAQRLDKEKKGAIIGNITELTEKGEKAFVRLSNDDEVEMNTSALARTKELGSLIWLYAILTSLKNYIQTMSGMWSNFVKFENLSYLFRMYTNVHIFVFIVLSLLSVMIHDFLNTTVSSL